MPALKKIDANKLNADLATFQRIYNGETYYRTELEYLELPRIARKSVPGLCDTGRTAGLCRETSNHGYWCNSALTFRITDQDSDLIPEEGKDYQHKNIMGPIQEMDISAKRFPVVVVAQNADRVMFECSGVGRIVIQEKFLQVIKRFGVEQIESFSTDNDFSCIRVIGVSGEMIGLIMGIENYDFNNDLLWLKTDIAERKEKLSHFFNVSDSVSVVFDKQITENGIKIIRIRFGAVGGMMTILTAEKRYTASKWSLRKEGVHDISFADLRSLKKFARAMAGCMSVGKSGFVEFDRKDQAS